MGSRKFGIVVAAATDSGIGKSGTLPWKLKGDMAYFKQVTSAAREGQRNVVIMGRKTWDSIPAKFRPLPDRLNVVLSRTLSAGDLPENVVLASSLESALAAGGDDIDKVFVIGGSEIYKEALSSALCATVYLTRVHETFDCDAFFPDVKEDEFELRSTSPTHEDNGIRYEFCTYERR